MKGNFTKKCFLSYIVLLLLVKKADFIDMPDSRRKKHERAFFTLNEVSMTNVQTSVKSINQTNILMQEIKENLIKTFGLRKSMLHMDDAKQIRKPHNYMIYMSKKFEKMSADGLPFIANTVRGCSDLGEPRRRLTEFPHLPFKFDMSEIPSSETLIQSELKILMKTPQTSDQSKSVRNGFYRVTLHGVMPRKVGKVKQRHHPFLPEITSKTVEFVKGHGYRWLTFDVSSFIPYIQGRNKKYIKFVLKVKPITGGSAIDPRLLGIDSNQNEESNKALLVLFTGDFDSTEEKKSSRKKRSTTESSRSSSRRRKKKQRRNRHGKNKKRRRNRKGCRRKNMHVDFRDFGWTNWLYSPTTYNAYYCHGNCRYPVPEHLKASNHATIQSIIHSMKKDFVPPPCCVPSAFEPMPFLILDGPDRMVLKFKSDVIATACACR